MRSLPMGLEEEDIPLLTRMIVNNGHDRFPFPDATNVFDIEFQQLVRLLDHNYLTHWNYEHLQVTEKTFEALKDG